MTYQNKMDVTMSKRRKTGGHYTAGEMVGEPGTATLPKLTEKNGLTEIGPSKEYMERREWLDFNFGNTLFYNDSRAWEATSNSQGFYAGDKNMYKTLTHLTGKNKFQQELTLVVLNCLIEEDLQLIFASDQWTNSSTKNLKPWNWCGHLFANVDKEMRVDRYLQEKALFLLRKKKMFLRKKYSAMIESEVPGQFVQHLVQPLFHYIRGKDTLDLIMDLLKHDQQLLSYVDEGQECPLHYAVRTKAYLHNPGVLEFLARKAPRKLWEPMTYERHKRHEQIIQPRDTDELSQYFRDKKQFMEANNLPPEDVYPLDWLKANNDAREDTLEELAYLQQQHAPTETPTELK